MTQSILKISLFALFLGFMGCETREITPIALQEGKDYFPLSKGVYMVYQVHEIKYNLVSGDSILDYYIKEKVEDSLIDEYQNLTYTINRYKKNNLSDSVWAIDSAFSARMINNQFIKEEQNIPVVKLVIPLTEGKEWNGNAYNVLGEEKYKMEKINTPFTVNDIEFDSTLTQIQKMDSSSVSQDYRWEVYAKGVGMIYKKSIVTTNYQNQGALVFPIKIDKGIDFTQTIIEYGKE